MGHRLMIEFVGQGIRMSLDEAHDMLGGLRCQKDVDSRAVRCNAGKLQLRGEFFNITNSPSFAAPGSSVSAWTGSGSAAVPTNAGNFGVVTATNAFYTPRDIQIALKLLF